MNDNDNELLGLVLCVALALGATVYATIVCLPIIHESFRSLALMGVS